MLISDRNYIKFLIVIIISKSETIKTWECCCSDLCPPSKQNNHNCNICLFSVLTQGLPFLVCLLWWWWWWWLMRAHLPSRMPQRSPNYIVCLFICLLMMMMIIMMIDVDPPSKQDAAEVSKLRDFHCTTYNTMCHNVSQRFKINVGRRKCITMYHDVKMWDVSSVTVTRWLKTPFHRCLTGMSP